MRVTRYARNGMRLRGVAADKVRALPATDGGWISQGPEGNITMVGVVDGEGARVVIAIDDPGPVLAVRPLWEGMW